MVGKTALKPRKQAHIRDRTIGMETREAKEPQGGRKRSGSPMKEMEEKFRSIIRVTRGFPTLEPALVSQLRDYL